MNFIAAIPITLTSPQGNITIHIGQVLILSQAQADMLGDKVKAADFPIYESDWKPTPSAWLTNAGELNTSGVFHGSWPDGGLTLEICRLTIDNLPLQAKLLRLHIPAYSPPAWIHTIRLLQERSKHLFEVEGMELHQSDRQSASELNLLAFAEELHLIDEGSTSE